MTFEAMGVLTIVSLVVAGVGFAVHGWAVNYRKNRSEYRKTNAVGWTMTGLGAVGIVASLAFLPAV